MKKFTSFILVLILILGSTAYAQDVSFRGSAKNVVRTGERFQLTYTVDAEGQNFRGPALKGFQVLSGPSTSQSSSIQIINGNVSRTVEYTFTYILQAGGDDGIFEIPPAEITVDGKKVESNPVKIQVVKSATSQQGSRAQGQQGSQGNQGNSSGNASDDFKDDVFIRAVADKSSPMQGEQVTVTYKLYYRVNINAPDVSKEPSFKGFWVENLIKNRQNYVQYQENYNGQLYHVAEIKKLALFPQQSGKTTITPLQATCQAQVRQQTQQRSKDPFFDSFFNDPFFNRYKTVEIPLTSNSLTLNVKPLPTTNKPAEFSGAVGDFDFSSSVDKTSLKTNEALNLKFTVSGTGNVELVDQIHVKFPPDFEVYDPKITKDISTAGNKVSGKKSFEYLIIPRTPGDFTIDPVKFVYYDLAKNSYQTITSPAYQISVAKGEGSAADVTYSGVNKSDVRMIGSDIRYIKTGNPDLHILGTFFFGSTGFYLLLIAPVILFILFIFIWKKELKKRSNMSLMRNRKATKVAKKRMKKAQQYMGENKQDAFYEEVSQALWGYLSDKFSIPLSNLSMDTVSETLRKREVKEETISQFIETLNNCEYARFAPGESHAAMENIYNEGIRIISIMEQELR